MIAISTFRALDENAEYRENQLRANLGWWKVFSQIAYFGKSDTRLCNGRVCFVTNFDDPPKARDMMAVAATDPGWSCIINADIVVDPRFAALEAALDAKGAVCAFSLRYQFKHGQAPSYARVEDMGLDIFCAKQEVWANAAKHVPPSFRIGKIMWDTWTLQFFARNYGDRCYDFTASRLIFHPQHGGRKNQNMDRPDDPMLKGEFVWPSGVLSI
jgi:hypothetical protein